MFEWMQNDCKRSYKPALNILFVWHKDRLMAEFTRLMAHKKRYVLDIPDDYKYMDPEVVEHFESSIPSFLNL